MTPLDNQELDKSTLLGRIYQTIARCPEETCRTCDDRAEKMYQLILSEAHRIGTLAIGEDNWLDDSKGWDMNDSRVVLARNDLRKEQRQKLSTLTGVKE
jgi:hypothetical protein